MLPAQTVRIVDAASGGPGALQIAVDASSAGDILRIMPGTYERTKVGRGLHLLAEPTADCHQLLATGIPAGETLTVVGLNLVGIPGTDNRPEHAPLRVESCQGKVFVSSCSVTGRQDAAQAHPLLILRTAAIRVVRAELHAEHVTIRGVDSSFSYSYSESWSYYLGGPGLSALEARVTLSSCQVRGGIGTTVDRINFPCQYYTGTNGHPAVVAEASLVSLDSSTLLGGNGGNGGVYCGNSWRCGYWVYEYAGPSGPGAYLTAASTLICLGTSRLAAGVGGLSNCGRPIASPAIGGAASTVSVDPGVALLPEAGAPAIDPLLQATIRNLPSLAGNTPRTMLAAPASWTHRDRPGALVFFLLAAEPAVWLPHPIVLGGVDIDGTRGFLFGPMVVPGGGQVGFGFTVPNDPTLAGRRLFFQSVGIDAALSAAATPLTATYVGY